MEEPAFSLAVLRKTGTMGCDRDPSSKVNYVNSPYTCTPGRSAAVELFLTSIIFPPGVPITASMLYYFLY